MQQQRTELKTGKRPQQPNSKTLDEGEVLFEEGTTGRELYIIQEGDLGVYKDTSEGPVELAVIGKGGIIGEMSLLDKQPRSATIKAVSKSQVAIVNEKVFQAALEKAPMWLTSIVKIVVSRLRDANKRVDQSVLRDRERGLVSLITLLIPDAKYEFSSMSALSYDQVVVEAYYVCRLKKKESQKILASIEKRGIIAIEEDTEHKKHITFVDLELISIYYEFLTLKSQQKKFSEIGIPEESVSLFSNIAYVAQKNGKSVDDGVALSQNFFVKDMSDKKESSETEKMLLNLRRNGLINITPGDGDSTIVFDPNMLSRIKKIREWIPRFEKKVVLDG